MVTRCPLCDSSENRPSWMGTVRYAGRDFEYRECGGCSSLYCNPMPDHQLLERMYGPEYATSFQHDPSIADPKQPERVLHWLRTLPAGTFLDYGCGQGALLTAAQEAGWKAVGVEFSKEVAARVAERTGAIVVTDPACLPAGGREAADVLHLGDVLEHLTEMDRQMPEIMNLLRPSGVLLAQGPLEANGCLFTLGLKLMRRLTGRKPVEMAPYHVSLATAAGQRILFRRFGLQEQEFVVREVAWPAPAVLRAADLRRPRSLALFTLRRLSQACTLLRPGPWGNRYFYAGRRSG